VYSHALIPTDGSRLSTEAVTHGVEFAKETGARVTLLTVTEPFHTFALSVDQVEDTPREYRTHMHERAARVLSSAAEVAKASGVSYEEVHVEDDYPYRAIIRTAEAKGCDLIIMASHGRRGISALVLGSETVKVLTHSTIPVLVHRLPAERANQLSSEHEAGRGGTVSKATPTEAA
jgi:nucleotide-binding universal stress UspA family protein